MVRFYTTEFFEELRRRLSADRKWLDGWAGQSLRLVCSAYDRNASVLIAIEDGRVRTEPASLATKATFRFEASYNSWVQLCEGEAEFEGLVRTGKIRVSGSMPDLLSLSGPLNYIVLTARSCPKTY